MQEQAVFTQKTEPVPPTGRFAPSPSGRLHLGNLACSLLAWLSARSRGGRIVLRIEDLDAERCPRIYAVRGTTARARHESPVISAYLELI